MKNLLADLRNDKGYSQLDLARILKVSQQTVWSWESGRTVPSPAMMQHLEDVLGKRKEDIFFDNFNYKM